MSVTLVKERYSSKVGEVVLGATPEQGGTRRNKDCYSDRWGR